MDKDEQIRLRIAEERGNYWHKVASIALAVSMFLAVLLIFVLLFCNQPKHERTQKSEYTTYSGTGYCNYPVMMELFFS